jgi:hypothetical protein
VVPRDTIIAPTNDQNVHKAATKKIKLLGSYKRENINEKDIIWSWSCYFTTCLFLCLLYPGGKAGIPQAFSPSFLFALLIKYVKGIS